MRAPFLLSFILMLAACTAANPPSVPASQTSAASVSIPPAARGLAFAQSHCASCHAVSTGYSSHNLAPPFPDIINDPDLTDKSLIPWLRTSHNFPEIMNFEIADEHVEDLAAYMLTLKNPQHKPAI